jgi:hypothetical protein
MNTSFIKISAWGNGLGKREKRILPNHLKDAN